MLPTHVPYVAPPTGTPGDCPAPSILPPSQPCRHAPSFPVWAVSGGQLLEVNERLAADPGLVFER